jgi:hypothetical protein
MLAKHHSGIFAVSFLFANFCGSNGAAFTYSNTNSIAINDSISPPTKATPYPSANLIPILCDNRHNLFDLKVAA